MELDAGRLQEWKAAGNKIALYGAGTAGILTYRLLKLCGVGADYFLDNDPKKRNTVIVDDVKSFLPSEILDKEQVIVFLCINLDSQVRLYDQAVKDGFLHFCSITPVLDGALRSQRQVFYRMLKLLYERPGGDIDIFLNDRKKDLDIREAASGQGQGNTASQPAGRIAVYTCVLGKYDVVHEPHVRPGNVDYFYISDEKPDGLKFFQWLDAKKVIPENIDTPIKRNRYAKFHPHLLFPDYSFSIYIDGNVEILKDISSYIHLSRTGISAFMHYRRDCIFYEGLQIVNLKRVVPDDVFGQMGRYLDEGMPLHYGLPEMTIIARDHKNVLCKKIMEEWWDEFDKGAQRDQLSFMYVMWKNGLKLSDISSLGPNLRECNDFIYHSHIENSKDIANNIK